MVNPFHSKGEPSFNKLVVCSEAQVGVLVDPHPSTLDVLPGKEIDTVHCPDLSSCFGLLVALWWNSGFGGSI